MTQKPKGIIGILTGGGDVPGLNPAIRAVTIRALREGYKVIGIRRGWKGLVDIIRDKKADNSANFFELTWITGIFRSPLLMTIILYPSFA